MRERIMRHWGWPKNLGTFSGNHYARYVLTAEGYKNIFRAQEGLCAGCKCELANPYVKAMKLGAKPQIDHWHDRSKPEPEYGPVCKPEEVRGLLCGVCNSWQGQVADNLELIGRIFEYLKAHEVKRGRG